MENFLAQKPKRGWRQDPASVLARFESHIMPEPNSGCWLWLATVTGRKPSLYGYVKVSGKMMPAHRRSWQLFRGKIPENRLVLHRCDNGVCVNPDHLWIGTQANNMRDCVKKGRNYRSSRGRNGQFVAKVG